MRYLTAGSFRTALEHRLLALSAQTGTPVGRLRKQVVFDRLLARLVIAKPERWVLKGALALQFRLRLQARTTNDMDLAHVDSEADATAAFVAVQSIDLRDHFIFSIRKSPHTETTGTSASRYHVEAELAGRTFEHVVIDVGFGDPMTAEPDYISAVDLLAFAGIAPVTVPLLPIEQHVAEKSHAYSRTYAGGPSTRVKDLVDLVLIQKNSTVDASRLRNALTIVFEARSTHPRPLKLQRPPAGWGPAYRRMAATLSVPGGLSDGLRMQPPFSIQC